MHWFAFSNRYWSHRCQYSSSRRLIWAEHRVACCDFTAKHCKGVYFQKEWVKGQRSVSGDVPAESVPGEIMINVCRAFMEVFQGNCWAFLLFREWWGFRETLDFATCVSDAHVCLCPTVRRQRRTHTALRIHIIRVSKNSGKHLKGQFPKAELLLRSQFYVILRSNCKSYKFVLVLL